MPRWSSAAGHRATGGGQGHLDLDVGFSILRRDLAVIDQSKIDNIDAELGVDDILERFLDLVEDLSFQCNSHASSLLLPA